MLRGLKGMAELNDEVGMVCGFEAESSRYLVQILPDVGLKKLKRENLVVLEVPPEFGGSANSTSGDSAGPGTAPSADDSKGGEEGHWAPGGDDAEMADAFKDCMPLFHDAFWSATTLDVEFTLGRVIQKVLRDMSVDKKVRRQRANALLRLGCILQQPMKERRKAGNGGQGGAPNSPTNSVNSTSTACTASSKRSMLTRFKPRAPWRTSAERRTQKARAQEAKLKRMEAALAMMAAGASTEDVDEMAAARATMEAEMEADGCSF